VRELRVGVDDRIIDNQQAQGINNCVPIGLPDFHVMSHIPHTGVASLLSLGFSAAGPVGERLERARCVLLHAPRGHAHLLHTAHLHAVQGIQHKLSASATTRTEMTSITLLAYVPSSLKGGGSDL